MSKIATEAIGSIPRPAYLQKAIADFGNGQLSYSELQQLFDKATAETISELEATGSAVITDGEQSKPSFVTYPIHGYPHLSPNGVVIPFADGHTRQLPAITAGPFKYQAYSSQYLKKAKTCSHAHIKQAVISVSAISLLYPQQGIEGYTREQFMADIVNEAEKEIRDCLNNGAYNVQIDFTEARLAIKLDPTKGLLSSFIDLNNQVLDRFTPEERKRIGVHTCPGGDADSTHSADVPYSELLPLLFKLHAGSFYMQYASEKNKPAVLQSIKQNLQPGQKVFLGVTDVLNPRIETPEEIRDLILEAARVIPVEQLGTTDDCGFSPFADDVSTAREIAFAKIRARLKGTELAEQQLGL